MSDYDAAFASDMRHKNRKVAAAEPTVANEVGPVAADDRLAVASLGLEEIIDVRYLFVVWLKWSWVAVIFALGGSYIGVQNIRAFLPVYKASMIVLPDAGGTPSRGSGGGVPSLLGNLGIGPSPGSSTFDRLKVMLGSVTLAQHLQEKHGLLQVLYASSWDEATGKFVRPTGEDFEKNQRRRAFFRQNQWSPPDLETLARFVGGAVSVASTSQGSFMELSVANKEPEFALELLELVYLEADELLREQDRIESRKRRSYVETQLARSTVLETRQALVGLLAGEQKTAMLLESELPYAARIIEPPFVSSRPSEPNVSFIMGTRAVAGGIIGMLLITLVAVFRRA